MPFLNVRVALYDYDANTEDELTIKMNDILYILEDDGPHWWKAQLKTADPNHSHIGLVPCNYVEPVSNRVTPSAVSSQSRPLILVLVRIS